VLTAVILVTSILSIAYAVLFLLYRKGWQLQKEFIIPSSFFPTVKLSVIVPARNEQQNIGSCLETLVHQNYPKELFEIIVVDDFSEDDTRNVVERFAAAHSQYNIRCLLLRDHLKEKTFAFKKAALEYGISQATGELIITTDADCVFPKEWLLHYAALYETEDRPMIIIAPVLLSNNNSMVQLFQTIDFTGSQGITAATHIMNLGRMSSGPNFAFQRTAFLEIEGYQQIDGLATGDDFLLLWKMSRLLKRKICYLKSFDATVISQPQYTWSAFLNQRIRWASKSGKYDDKNLIVVMLLVYVFNCWLAVLLYLGTVSPVFWAVLLAAFTFKVVFELLFLIPVFRFYRNAKALRYFVLLQPVHIAYIITAGFLGFIGEYEWKGRRIK
jgi:cellulose synthase/poly-beta-1,6-N-acetylglucosamine synthase-like glycosyltransferase